MSTINDFNPTSNKRIILDNLNPISLICKIADTFESGLTEDNPGNVLFQKTNRLILLTLMSNDTISQLDIVKSTKLKGPTVSVTLKKLENDGYVLKLPDDSDHRSVKVSLTEKGREAAKMILNRINATESAYLNILTDYEYRQVMNLLLKIESNIKK